MRCVSLLLALHASHAFVYPSMKTPSSLRARSRNAELKIANFDQEGILTLGEELDALSRRKLLGSVAAASFSFLVPQLANAESIKLEPLDVSKYGFQIMVPNSWEKSEQTLQDRRKITLFIDPASDRKTLMFLAFTPIRDDFTQLSSFGNVEQVAQTTILPKGEIAGEETASRMIKSESKKNAYFFDYVADVPGQPETHYRTIFAIAPNDGAAGSTLVTITVQTPEDGYSELKGTFDDIISSYGTSGK